MGNLLSLDISIHQRSTDTKKAGGSLNVDDLFALINAKKVGMDDARKATTDRMKFIDMFK